MKENKPKRKYNEYDNWNNNNKWLIEPNIKCTKIEPELFRLTKDLKDKHFSSSQIRKEENRKQRDSKNSKRIIFKDNIRRIYDF